MSMCIKKEVELYMEFIVPSMQACGNIYAN